MNRDIKDLQSEYRHLVEAAYGRRHLRTNDVVDLVRTACVYYNTIKRLSPEWKAPMEKELREMVEIFTIPKSR